MPIRRAHAMRKLILLLFLIGFAGCGGTITPATTPKQATLADGLCTQTTGPAQKIPAGWACDDVGCFEQFTIGRDRTITDVVREAMRAGSVFSYYIPRNMTRSGSEYYFPPMSGKVSLEGVSAILAETNSQDSQDPRWQLVTRKDQEDIRALCESDEERKLHVGCQCAWTNESVDDPAVFGRLKVVITPEGLSQRVTDGLCGVVLRK